MKSTVILFALVCAAICHEICKDSSGSISVTNSFCSEYSGKTCCTANKDTELKNLVDSLAMSDQTCLRFIRNVTCATCDTWGGHLFATESGNGGDFPRLCSSYCGSFYQSCSQVTINWPNGKNPFGTSSNRIADTWSTQSAFCEAFKAVNSGAACYSGEKYVPPNSPVIPPGNTKLCLTNWGDWTNGNKLVKLVDPKDNSSMYAAYQDGTISRMRKDNGVFISQIMKLDSYLNNEQGTLGLAIHPKYSTNGKFYVFWSSLNTVASCSNADWCEGNACTSGKCTGNTNSASVLEEFKWFPGDSSATKLRRIMEIPKYAMNHNGGDIVFHPKDGYLYVSVGDGGEVRENSQNLQRRPGKILRFDVDSTNYINGRNYAVPSDNPFLSSEFPEIYAYGLRNPWRMSFDAIRPSYLLVGDVGESTTEEWNLVVKGGNYGWPNYEGKVKFSNRAVLPERKEAFIEMDHEATKAYSAIGGYIYRGKLDACSYGKYLFADWNGAVDLMYAYESPANSGSFVFNFNTQKLGLKCGNDDCSRLGLHAFSEDAERNVYLHSSSQSYRIANPSTCGLTCDAVIPTGEEQYFESQNNGGSNGESNGNSNGSNISVSGDVPKGNSTGTDLRTSTGTSNGTSFFATLSILLFISFF